MIIQRATGWWECSIISFDEWTHKGGRNGSNYLVISNVFPTLQGIRVI